MKSQNSGWTVGPKHAGDVTTEAMANKIFVRKRAMCGPNTDRIIAEKRRY